MPSEVSASLVLAQGLEVGHIRKSSTQLPVAVRPLLFPLSLDHPSCGLQPSASLSFTSEIKPFVVIEGQFMIPSD